MQKIKIGISHGDVNGISYEVILKALGDARICELCTPVIYGSPKVLAYHRKALDMEGFTPTGIQDASEARGGKSYIVSCVDENIRVELGKKTESAGLASFSALKAAPDALEKGSIDALVTGPVNKDNMQHSNFKHRGHTEYLQERFGAPEVMMLLTSELMKVGLVAGHIPISELSTFITAELVLKKLRILSRSLLQDFGIRNPRIAVLGLNPHAGDDGLLGSEEQEIILPAMEKARQQKMLVFGPYAADGFFGAGRFSAFDAVLAMYHDQGLAPFKALNMDKGVNYTAGLPVVRTSPAHGTAYELSGKIQTSAESLRSAIYAAIDVVRNRQLYDDISKNPLTASAPNGNHNDESPEDLEK